MLDVSIPSTLNEPKHKEMSLSCVRANKINSVLTEPGYKGNQFLAENRYSPEIWSPVVPKYECPYKTEAAFNGYKTH